MLSSRSVAALNRGRGFLGEIVVVVVIVSGVVGGGRG